MTCHPIWKTLGIFLTFSLKFYENRPLACRCNTEPSFQNSTWQTHLCHLSHLYQRLLLESYFPSKIKVRKIFFTHTAHILVVCVPHCSVCQKTTFGESVLCHHTNPGNQFQVVSLGRKRLYLLNHLAEVNFLNPNSSFKHIWAIIPFLVLLSLAGEWNQRKT